MVKTCVVLVGNIGSGKSTFARGLIEAGYIAVSRDQVRYALGEGQYIFKPEYESAVHSINMCMFRQFMALETNILVDETNVSVVCRENYVWAAKNRGYKVIAVELPRYDKEESIKRRMASNHGKFDRNVWENVWTRFDSRYVSPTVAEGFDAVIKITGDSDPEDSVRVIQTALKGIESNGF